MNRLKSVLAAAALLLSVNSFAHADSLSKSELQQLAPGRYVVTLYNAVSMTVVMKPNGTVSGTTANEKDSGTWKLSGNRLCIAWTKWLNGKNRCSGLTTDGNGFKGNGFTIHRI